MVKDANINHRQSGFHGLSQAVIGARRRHRPARVGEKDSTIKLEEMGVDFLFNKEVTRVAAGAQISLAGESAARSYDAVVMCAGLASARLLAPMGLKIPLTAVHG